VFSRDFHHPSFSISEMGRAEAEGGDGSRPSTIGMDLFDVVRTVQVLLVSH
jgi:hypothetical protein